MCSDSIEMRVSVSIITIIGIACEISRMEKTGTKEWARKKVCHGDELREGKVIE